MAHKAEEEKLEQHRRKQRAGRMDGTATDAPCSEGSSSTDSVCGLHSSESLPVSDGSAGGPTVADVIKTEEDLECEDSLTSTSSDSVCLLPSLSSELRLETKGRTSDLEASAPEGVEAGAAKGEAAEGETADTTGRGEAAGEGADEGAAAGGGTGQGEEEGGAKEE
ncbi:chondroitin proteoglycan-2-like isoform X7 [Hypanus sabinus]|uniref:chondroitin proteoglycan-2-like isoform X7 n=1 Tax=Hypanus sabinus TaxID=79690 RepID=UPI0028C43AE3|nr:chondroitin proteoglycan-2-like isoform X7 [Hypanus sabinus]